MDEFEQFDEEAEVLLALALMDEEERNSDSDGM